MLLPAGGEFRLVLALDRLGRSLRDLLLLLDDLAASGCSVISLRESTDVSTPTGWLLVHLIASLAEFERELILDRVRAGVAAGSVRTPGSEGAEG